MKKLLITGLAAASATLAACSENPVTPLIADGGLSPLMATVLTPVTERICSTTAAPGFFVLATKNPNWSDPIDPVAGGANTGAYVGPNATSNLNATKGTVVPSSYGTYVSSFNLPSNAQDVTISGNLFVDNDVTVAVNAGSRFFSTFPNGGDPANPLNNYTPNAPTNRTRTNFQPGQAPAGGLAFTTSSGFIAGQTNTVNFTLYNDNNPDTDPNGGELSNPTGLSFCYTVSYNLVTQTQDGTRGCSPGYWKNHQYPANSVTPNSLLSSVGFNYGGTFDEAINNGGGGVVALMRHAASAYLNAVIFGSSYGMTPQEVVNAVNTAISQGSSAISALSDKLAGMEDVNGRVCDAGTPNTNGGGKKK